MWSCNTSVSVSDLDLFGENSYEIHLASVFNMFDPEIATIINTYEVNITHINMFKTEIATIINSCYTFVQMY